MIVLCLMQVYYLLMGLKGHDFLYHISILTDIMPFTHVAENFSDVHGIICPFYNISIPWWSMQWRAKGSMVGVKDTNQCIAIFNVIKTTIGTSSSMKVKKL